MINLKRFTVKIAFLILFISGSCRVTPEFTSFKGNAFKGLLLVPMAIAKYTIDASKVVYRLDSLPDRTKATINSMNMRFEGRLDTFQLDMDQFHFHFINDSLIFENLVVPRHDGYVQSDTLISFITCHYTTPRSDSLRCLYGSYMMIPADILNREPYEPCKIRE
jgi:hypothetical protein